MKCDRCHGVATLELGHLSLCRDCNDREIVEMNISEAAKKAEKDIYEEVVVCALSDGDREKMRIHIQSAIDAETAAKDAEIARLKQELAKWQCQSDDDEAMEIVVRQEKSALVEALKEINEYAKQIGADDFRVLCADALKKVGAE